MNLFKKNYKTVIYFFCMGFILNCIPQTLDLLENVKNDISFKELIVDSNIAKVSLVGVGMRSQAGVASKAFKALSENDVNIQIICTSEIKITMVVEKDLVDKAVELLHKEFELEK